MNPVHDALQPLSLLTSNLLRPAGQPNFLMFRSRVRGLRSSCFQVFLSSHHHYVNSACLQSPRRDETEAHRGEKLQNTREETANGRYGTHGPAVQRDWFNSLSTENINRFNMSCNTINTGKTKSLKHPRVPPGESPNHTDSHGAPVVIRQLIAGSLN